MSKIVIALGGNALGNTAEEQKDRVKLVASSIADLIEAGNQVVITHGNGPQVGMINTGLAYAAENQKIKGAVPFPECGAMSQGYIGYHLQNSIQNELIARGMADKNVLSVVTQVLVDEADPAFQHPSKPVGAFYTKEQANQLAQEAGWTMIEDSGRGYRRVVPSPLPLDIVEKDAIKELYERGNVVIAVGGGGVPVIQKNGRYDGVAAVIDKDYAAAKLSSLLGADIMMILTAVDRVSIHFNTPEQQDLEQMTVAQAKEYCAAGYFAAGSMLPKVKAAMSFAETNGVAIIASLEQAGAALNGQCGTRVIP